jgi:hypothetical protein
LVHRAVLFARGQWDPEIGLNRHARRPYVPR